LTVANTVGTTASDLNIVGTATGTTINGSFEKTIDVTANDTLTTVQQKINALGFAVSANIVNDGSGVSPFRLSLTARNSGRDGRFLFDAGTTGLGTTNLVDAQDAAMFIGGTGSTQPLLITSSTNQITNVIKGVTINLNGVSSNPVTLNVSQDSSNVSDQLDKFTSAFNDMVDKIDTLTSFDSTTMTKGLLLGESSIQNIQTTVYNVLTSVVSGAGRYRTLADLGLKLVDGAKLEFDADKFKAAYAADPTAVQNLFTQANTGIGNALETAINKLIDPTYGSLTIENKTLDQRTQQFQDRIDLLDKLLTDKRTRLEQQFANMESVLATLQSQQSALASLSTTSSSSSSSSKSSSSSSSS
jgi:flagellar hook-associated protein 2